MNIMQRDLARFGPRNAPRRGPGSASAAPGQNGAPQGANRPAPQSTAAKGDNMFQIMRQLSDLLIKENASLKRHRVEDVHAMTERKEQLARLYQGHMNAVHRDPNIVRNMDDAKKIALVQTSTRLTELMKENASLLKANIQAINTFMKCVVNAVKSRNEEKSASYSRAGFMSSYGTPRRQLAVSFNQTM